MHAALSALADAEGIEMAEFIERAVVAEIRERVRVITMAASKLARLGITGSEQGAPGTRQGVAGNGREDRGAAGSAREFASDAPFSGRGGR
jgi:hypothetical protein